MYTARHITLKGENRIAIHKATLRLNYVCQKVNEPYSAPSLQNVCKHALAKAGINKPVTLHWLRHSYATHLLENGTDLMYIQELPGHNSSRTTEVYTHVSTKSLYNIKSPFDDLNDKTIQSQQNPGDLYAFVEHINELPPILNDTIWVIQQ